MSLVNYASREINCKIVYYGTGLGGKTTNLEYVYSKVNPDVKGKMISLGPRPSGRCSSTFFPSISMRRRDSRRVFTSTRFRARCTTTRVAS
jgi:hypothetical protein